MNRISEDSILSTKELLDIIFTFDRRRLKIKDFMEVIKPLPELASGLGDDDLSELCRWVIHGLFKDNVTPKLEENLKLFLKREEVTMKYATDVWLEEKMEQAEKKKALKIAQNLKVKGFDVNTIAESTGLTVDDVLCL